MPDLRAGLPAPAQGDEVGLPAGLRAPPWRIEKSFRMSKHDLQARPVYHLSSHWPARLVRTRRQQPKVPQPQRYPPKPARSAPHLWHPHSDSSEADA